MTVTGRLTRPQQAEANRLAVLDAAFEVFAAVGYGPASLDRIAEQAGFSKGAVYSRFDSKADLFLAVLARRIEQRALDNASEVAAAIAEDRDPVGALTALTSTTSADDAGWQLACIEFRVLAARDDELRHRYRDLHAATVDLLCRLVDDVLGPAGATSALPSRALARTLLALDTGTVLEDAAAPAPLDIADRIAVVRTMFGRPGRAGDGEGRR